MNDMKTDIACVRFGNVHVIPIVSPIISQEVLRKMDATFASRPTSFATKVFSRGYKTVILSPFGDQWKKMKKILVSEIICPKRHHFFHDKRIKEADHLLRYVYNKAKSSEPVNLREVTRHYCGNLIRNLMFNKRYFGEPTHDGGPGPDEIEHVNATLNSLAYLYAFSISDYFPWLIGLNLDGHETIIKATSETFKKFHDPIVDERVRLHRESEEHGVQQEPQDFLDILIMLRDQDGPLLTPEEIKALSDEMMIASVENPSNAVEWILAEMMKNPAILQKAVEEIDHIVGKERLVQEADIPHL
ncbi:Cytochrome P450 [Rhynchospora pubera]|uniref:Cytochrome P450 n=1 Tax=Rhynchospora pubera TaxID=906938 RepID=A0AAV8C4U6_9POAL|nr:Cytochrome P450 [Rhynchospora pubera]